MTDKSVPVDTLINLTPHDITILRGDQAPLVVKRSGQVARVEVITVSLFAPILGCEVVTQHTLGPVVGLLDPVPGTAYLVSLVVRQAVPGRSDLLSPGPLMRDEKGWVDGCVGLVANPAPRPASPEVIHVVLSEAEADDPHCTHVEVLSAYRAEEQAHAVAGRMSAARSAWHQHDQAEQAEMKAWESTHPLPPANWANGGRNVERDQWYVERKAHRDAWVAAQPPQPYVPTWGRVVRCKLE